MPICYDCQNRQQEAWEWINDKIALLEEYGYEAIADEFQEIKPESQQISPIKPSTESQQFDRPE